LELTRLLTIDIEFTKEYSSMIVEILAQPVSALNQLRLHTTTNKVFKSRLLSQVVAGELVSQHQPTTRKLRERLELTKVSSLKLRPNAVLIRQDI